MPKTPQASRGPGSAAGSAAGLLLTLGFYLASGAAAGAAGMIAERDRQEKRMDDREIMARIGQLVDEEHELLERGEQRAGLEPPDRERLRALHVEVDRLWDLLRQRRARRHAGFDPDGAKLRSARTVEGYRQ